MRNLIIKGILFSLITIAIGCKKGGSNSTPVVAPSNLTISATVSADSSGNVSFNATADNAVSYSFDLGDGNSKTSYTGTLTYQYTQVGTNSYTVTVTATGSTGLTAKKSIPVTVTVKQPFTTLVWSDEFNTDGAPDTTKWGYDLGNNGGWGNNELEYYTNRPQNVIVQGGYLKIIALKEGYMGSPYTSARMLSQNKFSFQYGKVDISAQLPSGVGTWPALWMLGSNINTVSWPACGEIDIMEQVGRQLNTIYGTLHYPGNDPGSTTVISNASTAFHKYTLEWSSTLITIMVDDVPYFTFPNTNSLPFNQNFFMIFNIAMGGNFGGAVAPSFTSDSMLVDYVRVYK